MELLTTVFEYLTGSVPRALFLAGVMCGMFVFPIFAVIIIRRRVRERMSVVLEELADRDPWLISVSSKGTVFDVEKSVTWLRDLCKWYEKYSGIQRYFGAPALDSMCVQVTNELLNVYLSWSSEICKLPPESKRRLTAMLGQLKRYTDDDDLDTLLRVMGSADDPLAWFQPLRARAAELCDWKAFLKELDLADTSDPYDAGMNVSGNREQMALALALLADQTLAFRENLSAFVQILNHRFPRDLRVIACQLDQAFKGETQAVIALKRVQEGDTSSVAPEIREHPEWRQYVLAFGRTPLAALKSSPTDKFAALRKAFSKRMKEIQSQSLSSRKRTRDMQAVDQAWQVMLMLKAKGLWK